MSICAQHYHINRLRTDDGRWRDLRDFDAMFFPLSKTAALVTIAKHDNILGGMVNPTALGIPGRTMVGAIEYTVTACSSGKFLTEDFMHQFKESPRLAIFVPPRIYVLQSANGALFTTRALDDMLSSKLFGSVQGAQFCC